jgi:hypothetical protein
MPTVSPAYGSGSRASGGEPTPARPKGNKKGAGDEEGDADVKPEIDPGTNVPEATNDMGSSARAPRRAKVSGAPKIVRSYYDRET